MRIILLPTTIFDSSCKPWAITRLTSKFSSTLGIFRLLLSRIMSWIIHQVTHPCLCYRSLYADYYQRARLFRHQRPATISPAFYCWLYCHHCSWNLFWQVQTSWPIYHWWCSRVYDWIYITLLWWSSRPVVRWGLSMCYRHISNHRSWPFLGKLECRRRLQARSCDSDGHWHRQPWRVRLIIVDAQWLLA